MRRSRCLLWLLPLALAALLASCGGSSGGGGGGGQPSGSSNWGELVWGQDQWSD